MASRIVVIEEPCPNCRQAGLYCELCNGYGVLSRRVLDPGSFVLIEKVDGEWPAVPCLSCDGSGVFGEDRPGHVIEYLGCPDCQGQGIFPYALTSEMFDALAGGES